MVKFDFNTYNNISLENYNLDYLLEKFKTDNKMSGWYNLDTNLNNVINISNEIKENADVLIVIGIGGSYLGAQAVIDQLMSKYSNERIYVSFVGFATDVRKTIQPERIDSFKSKYLNADIFCKYVKQSTWSGSDSGFIANNDNNASGTNYIVAFNQARQLITSNKKPQNEIYFITDGEQSHNLGFTDAAAIQAADNLRASVNTATINAIYLNSNLSDERSQEAISVLTEIARSEDRVKSVSSASELAASLDDFKETTVEINTSSYPESAILTVAGYPDAQLGIQSIQANASNTEWTYRTQPFYLVATDSGATANIVNIKLQSNEGTSLNNKITINYTKK